MSVYCFLGAPMSLTAQKIPQIYEDQFTNISYVSQSHQFIKICPFILDEFANI